MIQTSLYLQWICCRAVNSILWLRHTNVDSKRHQPWKIAELTSQTFGLRTMNKVKKNHNLSRLSSRYRRKIEREWAHVLYWLDKSQFGSWIQTAGRPYRNWLLFFNDSCFWPLVFFNMIWTFCCSVKKIKTNCLPLVSVSGSNSCIFETKKWHPHLL